MLCVYFFFLLLKKKEGSIFLVDGLLYALSSMMFNLGKFDFAAVKASCFAFACSDCLFSACFNSSVLIRVIRANYKKKNMSLQGVLLKIVSNFHDVTSLV